MSRVVKKFGSVVEKFGDIVRGTFPLIHLPTGTDVSLPVIIASGNEAGFKLIIISN